MWGGPAGAGDGPGPSPQSEIPVLRSTSGRHSRRHEDTLAPPRANVLAAITDPGRRGLRAMLGAAALIAVATALWAWQARPHPTPVSAVPAGAANSLPASPAVAWIVIAVGGKVAHPGLVKLPAGARVADAIEAAGGVLPGVDISTLNLARKLTDGELITVGSPSPDGGGPGQPAGPLNLNAATLAQLDTLPGVGPTLAQRIIDYREAHGGFKSVAELQQVSGIGDSKFAEIKDLVTV
jgi:competence protein ComEA